MTTELTPITSRCGTIAVVGAPNAGKSTLVNALVGQKVAIVSPKVQTTRQRLVGIAIHESAQMLLVDTHQSRTLRRRWSGIWPDIEMSLQCKTGKLPRFLSHQ